MTLAELPTAVDTATAVSSALRDGKRERADRLVTELFGRVIGCADEIPPDVLAEPPSTGDQRYDTLIRTGLAYALHTRGISAEPWMTAVDRLTPEWLWDSDGASSAEYVDYIRAQTPRMFLAKGILLRDRDLRIL